MSDINLQITARGTNVSAIRRGNAVTIDIDNREVEAATVRANEAADSVPAALASTIRTDTADQGLSAQQQANARQNMGAAPSSAPAIIAPEIRLTDFPSPLAAFAESREKKRPVVIRERDLVLLNPSIDTGAVIDLIDVEVDIVGENGRLFRSATTPKPNPFIRIKRSYPYISNVVGFTVVPISFGGGPTLCLRMILAPNDPVLGVALPRDVYKLVAETFNPGSIATDNERIGEHMTVVAVDPVAATIDFLGLPREDWLSAVGVRACLRNRLPPPRIQGDLTFSQEESSTINHSGPMIFAEGCSLDIRGFTARDAKCPGMELNSCYRFHADFAAHNLGTSIANNQLGYGLVVYASSNGFAKGIGSEVRHLITTGTRSTTANDPRVERHGAGMGNTFEVDAWDCYGAAADEHSDGFQNVWRGSIRNCAPGDNTSNTCAQFRGRQTTATLTTEGLRACLVKLYSTASGGHMLSFTHRRPYSYDSFMPIVSVEGTAGITETCRTQISLNFVGEGEVNVLQAQYATVHSPSLVIDQKLTPLTDTSNRASALRALEGATMTVDRVTIDWSRSTANANTPAIGRASTGASIVVKSADMTIGSRFYYVGDLGASVGATVVVQNLNADKVPSSQAGGIGGGYTSTSASGYKIGYRFSLAGEDQRGALRTRNASASSTIYPYSPGTWYLTGTLTTAQALTIDPGGWAAGQELLFIRQAAPSSTAAWTIVYNGSTIATLPMTTAGVVRIKFSDDATPVPIVMP